MLAYLLLATAAAAADEPLPFRFAADPQQVFAETDDRPLLAQPLSPPTLLSPELPTSGYPIPSTADTRIELASVEKPSLEDRVKELEKQLKKQADADTKKQADDAKKPSVKFTMQLEADAYTFGQDELNKATVGDIEDGTAFRRARVGWTGKYWLVEYRIEVDFALSGRPGFLDNWVAFKDVPLLSHVKVGHYFEPFSLERVTPNRHKTFLERSLPDQPFAPARNLGIMAYDNSEDLSRTWAMGTFRTNSDVFGDDVGDAGERAVTGRLTWLPWYDEPAGGRYLVHLGAGYSFRDADNRTARFSSQPEARVGAATPNVPNFVDTGNIPAYSHQLFGLEAALVRGPFSLQSEYMYVPVDRIGGSDPAFQAWYVIASYFLTGEHRPYRREGGFFDRVIPFEDFFLVNTRHGVCAGWGAWEIAARLSHLDLDDTVVRGGRLTDTTVGVNWYMNPWTKIQANWIHAFLDNPTRGSSNADIFGIRMSFDF